jgi:hypothetical protein
MKVLYSIIVVVATTMVLSLLLFSSIEDKLVYAQQQEQNQTDVIDMQQEEIEMNLTLGKPIYTEKFTVPKSQNNNLTSSLVYSFSGNGNLNDIKVSAIGNGLMVLREDGTSSITDGRALFTSENGGKASYSFGAIIDIKDNIIRHLGAAFFDTNSTGNLEFLNSVVGVYKALIGDEKGTFTMWQLK